SAAGRQTAARDSCAEVPEEQSAQRGARRGERGNQLVGRSDAKLCVVPLRSLLLCVLWEEMGVSRLLLVTIPPCASRAWNAAFRQPQAVRRQGEMVPAALALSVPLEKSRAIRPDSRCGGMVNDLFSAAPTPGSR